MTEGQAEGSALGTEVFDAEVSARVAVMRAELERAEESMRTAVRFDLAKVCAPMLLCDRAGGRCCCSRCVRVLGRSCRPRSER